jgi:hypothetical protein
VSDRPLRVRIDRLVLRNVDSGSVGDIASLVADRLRREGSVRDRGEGPIPRDGTEMADAAASRIAAVVSRAVDGR